MPSSRRRNRMLRSRQPVELEEPNPAPHSTVTAAIQTLPRLWRSLQARTCHNDTLRVPVVPRPLRVHSGSPAGNSPVRRLVNVSGL
jgi:hypothetical protein